MAAKRTSTAWGSLIGAGNVAVASKRRGTVRGTRFQLSTPLRHRTKLLLGYELVKLGLGGGAANMKQVSVELLPKSGEEQ